MSFAISDAVSRVLDSALDGLSMRQNVIADNIANVDTPGFRATSVDFENSLRSAIATGGLETSGVSATETPTDTPWVPTATTSTSARRRSPRCSRSSSTR